MFYRRLRPQVAGMVFLGFLCAGAALAQTPGVPASGPAAASPADPNSPRAGGAAGMVAFDPNQYRMSMSDRMRENLGATEEEWKTLEPMIEKVRMWQSLLAVRRTGMGVALGGWAGQGAEPTKQMQELTEELTKTAQELAKVSQDPDAGPDRIKLALKDYCEVRARIRSELEKAQKELKDLLSVRQEAVLKQMGVVD
jgi:hypothetical protein